MLGKQKEKKLDKEMPALICKGSRGWYLTGLHDARAHILGVIVCSVSTVWDMPKYRALRSQY